MTTRRRTVAMLLGALGAGAVAASCGEQAGGCDVPDASTCIALQHDFEAFRTWERIDLGELPAMGGHPVAGHRFLYVNRRPPPGATTFPVGTLIVKTTEVGPAQDWEIHAMARRGGDYNRAGAVGWEYFELRIGTGDVPVVRWRGIAPSNGAMYMTPTGGDGDCNTCHGTEASRANDHVLDSALRLTPL